LLLACLYLFLSFFVCVSFLFLLRSPPLRGCAFRNEGAGICVTWSKKKSLRK
jgi:hypothetical protein